MWYVEKGQLKTEFITRFQVYYICVYIYNLCEWIYEQVDVLQIIFNALYYHSIGSKHDSWLGEAH